MFNKIVSCTILSVCYYSPILSTPGVVIIFNDFTPNTPSPDAVERTLSRAIIYPGYKDEGSIDDIALLKLSEPIPFTEDIRPACLATSQNETEEYGDTDCSTAGWGALRDTEQIEEGITFAFTCDLNPLDRVVHSLNIVSNTHNPKCRPLLSLEIGPDVFII